MAVQAVAVAMAVQAVVVAMAVQAAAVAVAVQAVAVAMAVQAVAAVVVMEVAEVVVMEVVAVVGLVAAWDTHVDDAAMVVVVVVVVVAMVRDRWEVVAMVAWDRSEMLVEVAMARVVVGLVVAWDDLPGGEAIAAESTAVVLKEVV